MEGVLNAGVAGLSMPGRMRREIAAGKWHGALMSCGVFVVTTIGALLPWMGVGSQRAWLSFFGWLVCGAAALSIVSARLRGIRGEAPTTMVLVSLFLCLAGWLVVLFGEADSEVAFDAKHADALEARWKGMFVKSEKHSVMCFLSGLLCFLSVGVVQIWGAKWRRRCVGTIVCSCGLLILVGVWGEFVNRTPSVRENAAPLPSDRFAFFPDEAAGVAFICLVWPIAAGGVLGRINAKERDPRDSLNELVTLVAVVTLSWLGLAVLGSLLGLLVSGFVAAGFCLWMFWRVPAARLCNYCMRCAALSLLSGAIALTGGYASGRDLKFDTHWVRLQAMFVSKVVKVRDTGGEYQADFRMRADGLMLSEDDPTDPSFARKQRANVISVCFKIIPYAGLLGFGPGSWRTVYPRFTDDSLLRTHYLQMQYAHQDFLQTVVEWGVLGAVAWGVLFLGALRNGFYRLRRYRTNGDRVGESEGLLVGAIGGLVAVLICGWWYYPFQVPAIQLIVTLLLGILWSAGERTGWSTGDSAQEMIAKFDET